MVKSHFRKLNVTGLGEQCCMRICNGLVYAFFKYEAYNQDIIDFMCKPYCEELQNYANGTMQ